MPIPKKIIRFITRHISPFDMGVLVLGCLCLLLFFLFFYRKSEYITIRVKVTDQDILYQKTEPKTWYADRFIVGDKELDALGRSLTEIVSVDSWSLDSKYRAVYLNLKVRAVYDTRTKLYTVRGRKIMFGTPIRFYLSKVTFDGFVTEFPGSEHDQSVKIGEATVTALARNLEPKIAEAIPKNGEIYDSNHTLLLKITDVSIQPAEKVTNTTSGDLLLRYDPLYKDVTITAEVRTKTVGNDAYIFDTMPLKIGELLPLNFDRISLPLALNNTYFINMDNYNIVYPIITDFTLQNP